MIYAYLFFTPTVAYSNKSDDFYCPCKEEEEPLGE